MTPESFVLKYGTSTASVIIRSLSSHLTYPGSESLRALAEELANDLERMLKAKGGDAAR